MPAAPMSVKRDRWSPIARRSNLMDLNLVAGCLESAGDVLTLGEREHRASGSEPDHFAVSSTAALGLFAAGDGRSSELAKLPTSCARLS